MHLALSDHPDQDIDGALERLGLRREWLLDSVKAGVIAQSESTALDPPGAGGYLAWLGTVRHLRVTMLKQGWAFSNAGNLASVISPDKKRSILVAQGNKAIGDLTKLNPRSKGKRGTSTKRKLNSNRTRIELLGQFPLFAWRPDEPVVISEALKEAEETWWLLLNRDEKRGKVFAELALPLGLDDKGRLSEMVARLPLGEHEIDLTDSLPGLNSNDGGGSGMQNGTQIVVEVKRRNAS